MVTRRSERQAEARCATPSRRQVPLLLTCYSSSSALLNLNLSSSKLFNNITSRALNIISIRIIRHMRRRTCDTRDSMAMLGLDVGFGAIGSRSHGDLALEVLERRDLVGRGGADGEIGYGSALGGGSLAAAGCCGAAGAGADLRSWVRGVLVEWRGEGSVDFVWRDPKG